MPGVSTPRPASSFEARNLTCFVIASPAEGSKLGVSKAQALSPPRTTRHKTNRAKRERRSTSIDGCDFIPVTPRLARLTRRLEEEGALTAPPCHGFLLCTYLRRRLQRYWLQGGRGGKLDRIDRSDTLSFHYSKGPACIIGAWEYPRIWSLGIGFL